MTAKQTVCSARADSDHDDDDPDSGRGNLDSGSVVAAAKDDGQHLTGQGVLELDRTAYGSHYGSGKLLRFLGPHLVNDHLHLNVKIHEERSGAAPSPLS